jgi:hypothetical protein
MKIDEDNFTCPIHYGILIEPCECVSCKNNFCKKCINDCIKKKDKCPLCSTSPFEYKENISLKRILNDIKFICQNCGQSFKNEDEYNSHSEICIIEKYVCIICEKEFNEKNFYEHIIKSHKSDIISLMNKNSMINKSNNETKDGSTNKNRLNLNISIFNHQNKGEDKKDLFNEAKNQIQNLNIGNIPSINKKNLPRKSLPTNDVNLIEKIYTNNPDFQNSNQTKEFDNQNNMEENLKINDFYANNPPITQRSMSNKIQNNIGSFYGINNNPNTARNYSNSVTKNQEIKNFDNIKYCYKENKTIPCSCCTEHICRPGSCLCKKCMFLNFKELKLKKGQLINKKGNVCNFAHDTFYCNQPYVNIVVNVSQKVFKNNTVCGIYNPCPECVILTKLKNFYLS